MRDVPLNAPESLLFYSAALAWSDEQLGRAAPPIVGGEGGSPNERTHGRDRDSLAGPANSRAVRDRA
jgi:hypothetical protein